nr:uncharacterized protein LOC123754279 isoform X1 [Procambarus clarkii]
MENEVQVLEVLPKSEETAAAESEHEEGEISEEDDDDEGGSDDGGETSCCSSSSFSPHSPAPHHSHNYPQHFSYPPDFTQERRKSKKISSVTSEVIIYDDYGRTAIFTSPKKRANSGGETSSYPRVAKGVRRWSRDDSSKWREKDKEIGKHQKDGAMGRRRPSAQLEGADLSVRKKNKRKLQASKKGREKTEFEKDAPGDPQVPKKKADYDQARRHRSPSSPRVSEISSCSDDESSLKPQRGRGKENQGSSSVSRVRPRSPLPYGPAKPPSQSTSIKQPPVHKPTFKKSSKHMLPKSPAQKFIYRKSTLLRNCHKPSKNLGKGSISSYAQKQSQIKNCKANTVKSSKISDGNKSDQLSKEKMQDIVLLKGQKQPPPGSLGEMLLKKTMKGKLKVRVEAGESNTLADEEGSVSKSVIKNILPVGEAIKDLTPECYTLDQEDEDELQLRLIALQSSLRVLSDVHKEGQDLACGSLISKIPSESNEETKNIIQVDLDQLQFVPNLFQQSRDKFMVNSNLESISEQRCDKSFPEQGNVLENSSVEKNIQGGGESSIMRDIEAMLDGISECSTQSPATPDNIGCEIVIDSINTHKSYMGSPATSSQQVNNVEDELIRDAKELSDCNQDPVDMDICDSSPEDEENTLEDDVLQEIGDDIPLVIKESLDTPSLMDISNERSSLLNEQSSTSSGPEGPQQNSNFQIPVEWAYMMPPPPPPDQPANDLSNIDNWCYDQNMYLQSMQSQCDSNTQYSHYDTQELNKPDWEGQQSDSPQWNCSHNEDHAVNLTNKDVVSSKASMSQDSDGSNVSKVENLEEKHVADSQKNLKDLPAEQYQAFMKVMIKQQTSQPKHTSNDNGQRNLIEVPLIKDVGKYSSQMCTANQLVLKSQISPNRGIMISKKSEARRRKRERQKKRSIQTKKKQGSASTIVRHLEQVTVNIDPMQNAEPLPEEEDEDVLRAKLLIDLSKKKQQKAETPKPVHKLSASVKTGKYLCRQKNSDQKFSYGCRETGELSPAHSYPSSSESSPIARIRVGQAAFLKSMHKQSRIKEGSPTHTFRTDSRPGLSDIGGFGLDPKSSQYDYVVPQDFSAHAEGPKFKFPLVKPVIINLNSDSEDETEEGRIGKQTSRKENVPEVSHSGAISSSIDLFLKSIRNARTGEGRSIPENPRPSGNSSPRTKIVPKDSTPNVVRHLSRTQQVEYRLLKEQLRMKEMLHRKKKLQQQRPFMSNRSTFSDTSEGSDRDSRNSYGVASAGPSGKFHKVSNFGPERESILDCPEPDGASGSGGMSSSREVCFKEMGRLQIQLANISNFENQVNVFSSGEVDDRGSNEPHPSNVVGTSESSQEVSAAEDEDEDTLRMRVLQTLQKNMSGRKVETIPGRITPLGDISQHETSDMYISNVPEDEKSTTTLKVVIHQNVHVSTKSVQESASRRNERQVVIQQNETEGKQESSREEQHDVDMGGEWMVLDEVLEEGIEGNGGNHSSDGEDGKLCRDFETENAEDEMAKDHVILGVNSSNIAGGLSGVRKPTLEGNECSGLIGAGETEVAESTLMTGVKNSKVKDKGDSGGLKDSLSTVSHEEHMASKNLACISTGQDIEGVAQVCKDSLLKEEKSGNSVINDKDKLKMNIQSRTYSEDGSKVMDVTSVTIQTCGILASENSGPHKPDNIKDGDTNVNKGFSIGDVSLSSSIPSSSSVTHYDTLSESDVENIKPGVNTSAKVCNNIESVNTMDKGSPPVEKPREVLLRTCSKVGQQNATDHINGSETDLNAVQIVDMSVNVKRKLQEVEKEKCKSLKINAKTSLLKLSTEKQELKIEKQGITKKTETKMGGATQGKSVKPTETLCPTDVNNWAVSGNSVSSGAKAENSVSSGAKVGYQPKASGKGVCQEDREKSVKNKRILLLKEIEHKYSDKRLGLNKVITQLASLVQEAKDEGLQMESLKKSLMDLRKQLKEKEMQLETKSSIFKSKMESIRELQTQITTDRKVINDLEQKGKLLGQQEYGSGYTLPKVLGSPHSKTKDAFRKKQLASNIDALRQQMRDVSNKSKARLQVDAHTDKTGSIKVLNMADNNHCSMSKPAPKIVSPNQNLGNYGTAFEGNVKATVKTQLQAEKSQNKVNRSSSSPVACSSKSKCFSPENVCGGNPSPKRKEAPSCNERSTKVARSQKDGENSTVLEKGATAGEGKTSGASLCSSHEVHLNTVEDGEKLDEMNELCPHDLLGRCNDDSCTYQHLAQPRNGSCGLMKPAASLTAKAGEPLRSPKTGMSRSGRMGPNTATVMIKPGGGTGTQGFNVGTKLKGSDGIIDRAGLNSEIKGAVMVSMTQVESGTGKLEGGLIGPTAGTLSLGSDLGPVPRVGTEGPVPRVGTEGPVPRVGTEGPVPRVGTEGPVPRVGTEGPVPRVGTEGPVPRVGTEGPVPRVGTEGPVPRVGTEGPVPRVGTEGPVPRVGTEGPVPRVGTEGPVPRVGTEGPVPRVGTEGPVPRVGTEGPVPRVGTEGPVPRVGTEGPVPRVGTEGPVPRVGTEGPVPRVGTEGPVPRVGTEGPVPRVGTEGPVPRVGTEGPVPSVGTEGPVPSVGTEGPVPSVGTEGPVPSVGTEGPVPSVGTEGPVPSVGTDETEPNAEVDDIRAHVKMGTGSDTGERIAATGSERSNSKTVCADQNTDCGAFVEEDFIPLDFRIESISNENLMKVDIEHKILGCDLTSGSVHLMPGTKQEHADVCERLKRGRDGDSSSLVNSESTKKSDIKYKRRRHNSEHNTVFSCAVLPSNGECKDKDGNSFSTLEQRNDDIETETDVSNIYIEDEGHTNNSISNVNTNIWTVGNYDGKSKTDEQVQIIDVPFEELVDESTVDDPLIYMVCTTASDSSMAGIDKLLQNKQVALKETNKETRIINITEDHDMNDSSDTGKSLYEQSQEEHQSTGTFELIVHGKGVQNKNKKGKSKVKAKSCKLLDPDAEHARPSGRPNTRRKAKAASINTADKPDEACNDPIIIHHQITRAVGRRIRDAPKKVVKRPPRNCLKSVVNHCNPKRTATRQKQNRGRGRKR